MCHTTLLFILLGLLNLRQSPIEDESSKLFQNIPLEQGIDSIKKQKNLKFDYGISYSVLHSNKRWVAHVKDFSYEDVKPQRAVIEMHNNSQTGTVQSEYSVSLILFFSEKKTAERTYKKLINKFKGLGGKSEESKVKINGIKFSNCLVFYEEQNPVPSLGFSLCNSKSPVVYAGSTAEKMYALHVSYEK